MHPAPQPGELLFIEDGVDGVGQGRRTKQSRAYVARVIRKRQKDEKLKELDPNAELVAPGASAGSSSKDSESMQPTRNCYSTSNPRRDNIMTSSVSRQISPGLPRLSATFSPGFGGLQITSHDTGQYPDAKELAGYCFNHVLSSWLAPELRPTWFAAFSQDPLTFHTFCYGAGVLQDIEIGRSLQPRRLEHRYRLIQLLNQRLNHLDTVDLEPIMLGVAMLWRIDTDQTRNWNVDTYHAIESGQSRFLFEAYSRSVNSVFVFGKQGGDEGHSKALVELVRRFGGLGNFKTLPGLHITLAISDMLDSSAKAKPPNFPSIWTAQPHLDSLYPAILLLSDDNEGQGFETNVPGGLPDSILTTLQRLSTMDKLLDDFSSRDVTALERYSFTILSYAVQHDLLSIPRWRNLTDDQRGSSSLASYELCRITAIIYTNAVIFPMSPDEGWLEKLLKQLRQLIETSDIGIWDESFAPLLLWALVIGGMASFWTSHRTCFVATLRQAMNNFGIGTWAEIHHIVRQFLWRESSCAKGAATFWDYLRNADLSI